MKSMPRSASPEMTEWILPAAFPNLAANTVHIWRASLEIDRETLGKYARVLSDEERARAERFVHERDRVSYIASHGFLRELLARYLDCRPEGLEFAAGAHGKPAISAPGPALGLSFNLSHAHGVGVAAIVRGREIGVDVEKIRPEFAGEEIAERYFSAAEIAELKQLPQEQRATAFFLCWTRKEAYVKALGEGLRFPLDRFSVSLTPGGPVQLLAGDAGRWGIRSFEAPTSAGMTHVGAVVCEGKDWTAQLLEWGEFEQRAVWENQRA
jgi:4'-phosphopantetheinyl transferase